MKSYTDLKQSKKLAKILPLESTDMCLTFVNNVWNPVWGKADDIYQLQKDCYEPDYTKDNYVDIDEFEPKVVPSWSLAALLSVLPILNNRSPVTSKTFDGKYRVLYHSTGYEKSILTSDYINPVDACYEMVLKLHELNLL